MGAHIHSLFPEGQERVSRYGLPRGRAGFGQQVDIARVSAQITSTTDFIPPPLISKAVPKYWKNKDLDGDWDERHDVPKEFKERLQTLLDTTWRNVATRDRLAAEGKGGAPEGKGGGKGAKEKPATTGGGYQTKGSDWSNLEGSICVIQ